ncbi:MAG: zf-HC2 domain-containing protein [Vicinamibacterales bacterium]
MECHEIQESILDGLDREPSPDERHAIEAHVSICATCAEFARNQQVIDVRLASALAPPTMAPMSRAALRARVRHDAVTARREALPECVHFASFGVTTLTLAWILPVSPSIVVSGGLTVALLSYVVLSVIRSSFEDQPLEA